MNLIESSWEGTLDDLVAEVVRQLQPFDLEGRLTDVNARLIRHYMSIDAMSKPVRLGREARFNQRHVLECLVIRILLADGWPLTKIADLVRSKDDAGLRGLLPVTPSPADDPRQRALNLAARFQTQANERQAAVTSATEVRMQLRRDLQALGNPRGEIERQELVRLHLAPGCEVVLGPTWWATLDERRIEQAAEAFKQVLREELYKRRGQPS